MTREDWEARRVGILQMIADMEPLGSTLAAVASAVGALLSGGKAAVLLVKRTTLVVVAANGFSEQDGACLAALQGCPLTTRSVQVPGCGIAFVVRTIVSGAGEILGALAVEPAALTQSLELQTQLQNVEGLAALAIERRHLVEELNYQLEHDSLTEVYDRLTIESRMSEALIGRTSLGPDRCGSRVALIVIGLDRFRRVNAALGHRVGNELLRQVAQRIQANCSRKTVVGRVGGDEFAVLMPRLSSTDEAAAMAERLTSSLRLPFLVGDHELRVTATAGIGISSPEAYRTEDLEARAYAAMEHAKSLGGNQSAFFDCSMVTVSPEYLELETRLRGALGGGELVLYYQPQLALHDYSTVGMEALLRWQHPDLGLVSPSSFIPMAEQGGLITEIGEWALKEGLRQMVTWEKSGVGPLHIGVNVSPLQFRRPDFARRILEIVERAGYDASQLLLEITEGTIMQDLEYAVAQMNRLRDAGIRFAIDDFGTGYSSLAYLQKLPADQLKIDRSFVQEILSPGLRPPLLENIIRLASELGIPMIAEGIETWEQADALAAMGCQEGQGFLFSKPLPGCDLLRWLHRAGSAGWTSPAGPTESLRMSSGSTTISWPEASP